MGDTPTPRKVVIAGAGIAGLSFAISLRQIWDERLGPFPHVTICEREPRDFTGHGGYSISLRSDPAAQGVQTLQKLGLLDQIITGEEENRLGSFGIWNLDWQIAFSPQPSKTESLPASGYRIARSKVRDILLSTASEHATVVYGTTCIGVGQTVDRRPTLQLEGNVEMECDLLVIADGASSKLRMSLRSDDSLRFTGISHIGATSRFTDCLPSPLDKDYGIIPNGKGIALFASPIDTKSAMWALSFSSTPPRPPKRQPLTEEENTEIVNEARRLGKSFKQPWQTLLDATDPSTIRVYNATDKEPFANTSENGVPEGVVFIGDANHAVSPFAANGANLAMMDAWDLAECLCHHTSVTSAVKAYDAMSMNRARETLERSRRFIEIAHRKG